jgi:NADH-quinone oxidoreductase subunit D
VDGDIVVDAIPDPGYVHRGEEKMCEVRTYIQNIPHLERPVILDSTGIILPYCLAAEELLDLTAKIPERATWLRMLFNEFNRIISHLYWLGIQGIFTGHSTMFMWAMGDREYFIDLAGMASGARVTFAYMVPGGVRNDTPWGFEEKVLRVCAYFDARLEEYRKIYFENPVFEKRTMDVGVLPRRDAIDLGCVGPTLRASGVKADTRKDDPYCFYDQVDFEVPVYREGDAWARCWVHWHELRQSVNIIRQIISKMRPGPVRVPLRGQLRGRRGEAYARAEAARGTLSYHIISDGGQYPYRVRISVPSFRNLPAMPRVLIGYKLADVPVSFWSLDYWPVEADK